MQIQSVQRLRALALLLSLLGLVGIGCSASNQPMAQAAPQPVPADQLARQIQALIGQAPCDDTRQCRAVGIGVKSCGGPASYLAWSNKHTPAQELDALVERHKQASQREDRQQGRVSNCAIVPAPGAQCVKGTCQLQVGQGTSS